MLMKIRRARLEREVPQWQLAQQAGIRAPRLSEIERGRVVPTPDELTRLARALGVGVHEIKEARDRGRTKRQAGTSRRAGCIAGTASGDSEVLSGTPKERSR